MIQQLVYTSREAYPLGASDLIRLLLAARERNRQLDVTGVLLYRDGGFMQLLEGNPDTVQRLFAHIGSDPRHADVALVLSRVVEDRLLHGWSMAYVDAPEADGREALEGLRPEHRVRALLERAPPADATAATLRAFLQRSPA